MLGVSKQAAHKRFADSWTSKPAFDRYTPRTQAVVTAAADVARERNHDFIGTEHLLLAFFTQPEALATKVLVQHGITEDRVREAVDVLSPAGTPTDPPKTRTPRIRRTPGGPRTCCKVLSGRR